jgi:TIR domain/CHAT domain
VKKILILTANPKNTDRLRLDEEVREIQAALDQSRNRDQFEIVTRWAVRVDDLQPILLDHTPEIVHFSGHGGGSQGLALENELGQMQLVSSIALAGLFKLFKTNVECVFLNACYSEEQAKAIYQHISCVVGMNQAIGDRAAVKFAKGFYRAIGTHRSYKEAFEFGCNAIDLQGIPESSTPVIKLKAEELSPRFDKVPNRQEVSDQNQENFQYDVYVSYVEQEPDATWVWDILLPRLKQANLRIAVSGDIESPGVARVVNIEQGIRQAKRTILVLSEAYLANYEATFENILGQTLGIQEGTYRLLPVKALSFDFSQLPTRLSMLTTLDLAHPRRAERDFERLIQALREPLPQM